MSEDDGLPLLAGLIVRMAPHGPAWPRMASHGLLTIVCALRPRLAFPSTFVCALRPRLAWPVYLRVRPRLAWPE